MKNILVSFICLALLANPVFAKTKVPFPKNEAAIVIDYEAKCSVKKKKIDKKKGYVYWFATMLKDKVNVSVTIERNNGRFKSAKEAAAFTIKNIQAKTQEHIDFMETDQNDWHVVIWSQAIPFMGEEVINTHLNKHMLFNDYWIDAHVSFMNISEDISTKAMSIAAKIQLEPPKKSK